MRQEDDLYVYNSKDKPWEEPRRSRAPDVESLNIRSDVAAVPRTNGRREENLPRREENLPSRNEIPARRNDPRTTDQRRRDDVQVKRENVREFPPHIEQQLRGQRAPLLERPARAAATVRAGLKEPMLLSYLHNGTDLMYCLVEAVRWEALRKKMSELEPDYSIIMDMSPLQRDNGATVTELLRNIRIVNEKMSAYKEIAGNIRYLGTDFIEIIEDDIEISETIQKTAGTGRKL